MRYLPSWMELTVSLGLVAVGFAVFAVAARFLPIFPEAARQKPSGPAETEEPAPGRALGESVPA